MASLLLGVNPVVLERDTSSPEPSAVLTVLHGNATTACPCVGSAKPQRYFYGQTKRGLLWVIFRGSSGSVSLQTWVHVKDRCVHANKKMYKGNVVFVVIIRVVALMKTKTHTSDIKFL